MKPMLFLAAKLLVSLVLIAGIAWRLDLTMFGRTLAAADPAIVALAAAQLSLQPFIGTVRWRWIIRALGGSLPFGQALRLNFVAIFFNQVLPGAVVGDGVRIWLAQRHGLSWRRAIHSVAAERLLMLALLVLLVLLAEPWLAERLGFGAVPWLWPAAGAAVLLALAVLLAARRLPPGWLRRPAVRWMHDLAEDLRILLFRPVTSVWLLLNGLISYASLGVTIWLLGLSVGAAIPADAYLLVVPPLILASVLPISIGGWGVREAAALTLLTAVGADAAQAVAISVLLGLVSLLVALPGLPLWLLGREERRRQAMAVAAPGPGTD
ncbi:MAG: lysylphosphatidylglycerol synthase transmembrane domain-containing protein [Sneathiellaceae bacterium]